MLFDTYYEELCRIVYPVVKDKDAAEDIVQDVFVKLWMRREELEVKTTYKAYLYKAVVLRGLDYLRREKSKNKASAELQATGEKHSNNTDAGLNEKQIQQAIDTALDQMSDSMRKIFELSRFSGLKNREIAEELGISIKTVESNMGKALKIMHTQLSPFIKNGALCFLIYYLSK